MGLRKFRMRARTGTRSPYSIFTLAALAAGLLIPGIPFLGAQTALPVASPDTLTKQTGSRSEIERCILIGDPESLARARDGISQSRNITEGERKALLEIVRGIECIVYPKPATPARENFSLPAGITGIPAVYSVALTQLVEASQGRIFAAPKGTESSLLHELLPSLAAFRSSDKETAGLARGYVERYLKASQQPSALASLVVAQTYRVEGSLSDAHAFFRRAFEQYPNLWPAQAALGLLSLQLGMPVNALNYLESLNKGTDPNLLEAYAIALYRNARLSDAADQAAKAKSAGATSPELSLIAAHVAIDAGKYFDAQPQLESFGRARPSSRDYLVLKVLYAQGMERTEEAIKWALKARQSFPDDPEIMVRLGVALFSGPVAGHEEARTLCEEAGKIFASRSGGDYRYPSPLNQAMAEEAGMEASRALLADAYARQDWFSAVALLNQGSRVGLDKTMVATILRKSGDTADALAFSSDWYRSEPGSDAAAEAYLRSLASAATGAGIASAQAPGASDIGAGLLGLLGAGGSAGTQTGSASSPLVSLVFQLLATSNSPRMRSYLFYLRGTFQTDENAAVESYKLALLERGDNVEALVALARIYSARKDVSKANFYLRQARTIGVADAQLAAEITALETSLAAQTSSQTQAAAQPSEARP